MELAVSRPRTLARGRLMAMILAGLAFVVFLAHQFYYLNATGFDAIDDAYISFRYAFNLAYGRGLVFNRGEQVEGYTNFLWTILMTPFIRVHLPPGPVSLVLGGLCGIGGLYLVMRYAQPRIPLVGALAALMLAVDGSYTLWSVSGMETSFFALLILAGAIRYWHEMEHESARPWSGLLFGLAALTRPEGALVFGLTVIHAGLYRIIAQRRLVTWNDIGRVLGFAVIFGAHLTFRYLYYGKLVPNTFTAKVEPGSTAQIERGWRALETFVNIHGGWLALLPLPVGFISMIRHGVGLRATYCALILIPYIAYIVGVGGDWSVGRFFAPLMPFAYMLAASGLVALGRWIYTAWSRRSKAKSQKLDEAEPGIGAIAVMSVLVVAMAVGLFIGSSVNGERTLFVDAFKVKQTTLARTAMGHWLKDNVEKEVVIAVDAAGQMPYYADRWFVDLYGLNDANIADLKTDTVGKGTAGHEKFGLDYVIKLYKPDYVVIYGNLLDAPVYQQYYTRMDVPWTNDPSLKKLLSIYKWRESEDEGK